MTLTYVKIFITSILLIVAPDPKIIQMHGEKALKIKKKLKKSFNNNRKGF